MIKYLISSTNEVRVDSMDEVEQFHKEMQDKAAEIGCLLASFSWVEKENKKLDEIYYQVKFKFVFNKLADPETPYRDIDYKMYEGINE